MQRILNIGLDLGGDTIKIAFAYEREDQSITYGKFSEKSKFTQIAIPAIGYYNVAEKKWYYGDQIPKQSESFLTVVKIKNLVSLLTKQERFIWERNKDFYYNGHDFPKFYFPIRRRMLDDFDAMVKRDMTFTCDDYTPQQVCLEFFRHVKKLIDKRCRELNKKQTESFTAYKIAVVHPSSVGDEYIGELSYLVKETFGAKPSKILNSTKALSTYAFHRGAVVNGESFLVFDMGEENISVTRAGFVNDQIFVDGVEGHNEPLELGGIDVDQSIVEYIYDAIFDRETIGSPSSGIKGHIFENGVYGKQYLLMKDVKKAKVILSKPLREDSVFNQGVPVSLSWDLLIQRRFTREDFRRSVGVEEDSGVARKICDYIITEIARPINYDVKKIFLSGGLAETYSLIEYIKEKIKNKGIDVQVFTFDDGCDENDGFNLLSYEDSVFAPAVGGAIAALKNIVIKTILSLSYATWACVDGIKCLSIFAERGEEIGDGRDFVGGYKAGEFGTVEEELFSTHITKEMIIKNRSKGIWNYTPNGKLIIGEEGSSERARAEVDFALRRVSGSSRAKIIFKHEGSVCKILRGDNINFEEGISVDAKGVATPILRNVSDQNRTVAISYVDRPMSIRLVRARSIEVVPYGLEGFVTVDV